MADSGDAGLARTLHEWRASAAFPRVFPFAVFMVFVAIGSALPAPVPVAPGELDPRWVYAARALAVWVPCSSGYGPGFRSCVPAARP